jgi:hypothetical protein
MEKIIIYPKLKKEARIRGIPCVRDLIILHEIEDRENLESEIMYRFRKDLNAMLDEKIRNGWNERIRESIRKGIKPVVPSGCLLPKVSLLKRKWHAH